MRSMVLNAAGGLVFAASLVAGHPLVAQDPPEDEDAVLVGPNEVPEDLKDVALANNPRRIEHSMSIAANPKNPNLLIVALDTCTLWWEGCRSVVKRSHDAGRTWSQPVPLPCTSACNGGALAYAPNGKRVYAAYFAYVDSPYYGSVVVSHSDDNGATWLPPVVALRGDESRGFSYHSPRIATPLDESESRWIYLTGVQDYDDPSGSFHFTRSADFGATWSTPRSFGWWDSESASGLNRGTVAGGKAGEVLVAGRGTYYPDPNYGQSGVLVRRSHDHGASFDDEVVAATEPSSGAPDVKIGHKGAAHIVYTRYPEGPNDDGDIEYIWSPGPPYTAWSKPVTVNDDSQGRSQFNPSLATQKCGASTVLHLVWEDARLRPMAPPDDHNSGFHDHYWDVFYARKIAKPERPGRRTCVCPASLHSPAKTCLRT